MKKQKCPICNSSRGKRICKEKEQQIICPHCCAIMRDDKCDGCKHYSNAQRVKIEKIKQCTNQTQREKHFIAEICPEAEDEVDKALMFMEKGQYELAEPILTSLKGKYPRNHHVEYALGTYAAMTKNIDEAVYHFKRATDIFPYFIEALYNLHVAYNQKLDVHNAIITAKKVIEYGNPEEPYVNQAKDFIRGVEKVALSEGVSLDDYFRGQEIFNEAFDLMENKNWDKALSRFKDCLEIHPRHYQSYGNVGLCYAALGFKDKAIEALDKAVELNPKYEPAIVNKIAIERMEDPKELQNSGVESIKWSSDYAFKKKSYIETMMNSLKDKVNY